MLPLISRYLYGIWDTRESADGNFSIDFKCPRTELQNKSVRARRFSLPRASRYLHAHPTTAPTKLALSDSVLDALRD